MAQAIRVGILGAGWPGTRHAEGYRDAGGFHIAAVADLIPARRKTLMQQFGATREVADAVELAADPNLDAVSICLPNHLHLPIALAALKAGKHVICEMPPCLDSGEMRKLAAAVAKAGKILMFAAQRRFGAAEQAARQAVEKGYIGGAYHARASWMRTRGTPTGTGWFTDRERSGGGVVMDLGAAMLDLAWSLLGQPKPFSVFALFADRLSRERAAAATDPATGKAVVEETAFVLGRFEGGKTLELSSSWAINQPPRQQGTLCRLHGDRGAIDLYTSQGPLLYRQFNDKGDAKESPMKLPKTALYAAMMRQFKQAVHQSQPAVPGPAEGIVLMRMIDAIYKSAQTGKSVALE